MDIEQETESVAEIVDADRRFYAVNYEALKQLRRAQLFTQLQLAQASGVTASTISQAESGRRRQVRALTLARLSDALGVAPGELLVDSESVELAGREAGDE